MRTLFPFDTSMKALPAYVASTSCPLSSTHLACSPRQSVGLCRFCLFSSLRISYRIIIRLIFRSTTSTARAVVPSPALIGHSVARKMSSSASATNGVNGVKKEEQKEHQFGWAISDKIVPETTPGKVRRSESGAVVEAKAGVLQRS